MNAGVKVETKQVTEKWRQQDRNQEIQRMCFGPGSTWEEREQQVSGCAAVLLTVALQCYALYQTRHSFVCGRVGESVSYGPTVLIAGLSGTGADM